MTSFISAAIIATVVTSTMSIANAQLKYPEAKKDQTVDDYFGTKVSDPYRWLENTDSPETKKWVEEENSVTEQYFAAIPFRDKIKQRLQNLINYPKYTAPRKAGKYYIYELNTGLQNQSVVYIQEGLAGTPRVLIDPNTLSADGTVAVGDLSLSNDDRYLGYSIQKAGSDWQDIYVLDLATGKQLSDHLEWVKFSGIAWWMDGFLYSRFDQPTKSALTSENENMQVYYHRLGTTQDKDELIYRDREHPKRLLFSSATEDERYLVLYISEPGTKGNQMLVKDTEHPEKGFVTINPDFDVACSIVESEGDVLYMATNKGAPRYRIVTTTVAAPDRWIEIVPESSNVIDGSSIVNGSLIVTYMKDASHHVYAFALDGKLLHEIKLPTFGSVSGFGGKKKDTELFYTFSSFTYPPTIYRYDIPKNESTVFRKVDVAFDPEAFEAKQIFYTSKDGTKVPMFIVHKKGLKLDGNNPCYLYGYGGFKISLTPNFSTFRIALLENGFVFAMANLRGGGEYGEAWHDAGTKFKKQNVFDDFIAAADYLCDQGYTSHTKLAIAGGSNGGLLVGAVMTERPDICKVALPDVGVMDMLRYQKFTIGHNWAGDYGTSEDSKEMFEYLYRYSPLHNLREGVNYPATLITTADHDDRVVPGHSFKFAATIQEKYHGPNPVLIRIETKAGHGAGKPITKIIEEAADLYSFMFYNFGVVPG